MKGRSRHERDLELSDALAEFGARIAHDLGNQLSVVSLSAQLLSATFARLEMPTDQLEAMARACRGAQRLLDRLTVLSDVRTMRPAPLSLREMGQSLVPIWTEHGPGRIEIRASGGADSFVVVCQELVLQAVRELVDNACEAGGAADRVVVELSTLTDLGQGQARSAETVFTLWAGAPARFDRRHARLAVTDAGQGMDRATLAGAVKPFFTTKRREGGAGLGLAIVNDIASRMGATLLIRSAPAQGTSVEMLFPILEPARGRRAAAETAKREP